MKRIIALLAISLVMCLVFAANVFADDLVTYVRFNSQAAVDKYINSSGDGDIWFAYDETEGALFFTYKTNDTANYTDAHIRFLFDQAIPTGAEGYDYMRITYKMPDTANSHKPNGMEIGGFDTQQTVVYPNYYTGTDGGKYSNIYISQTADNTVRQLYKGGLSSVKNGAGTVFCTAVNDLRVDLPNLVNKGGYAEVYIYDIGFFKSEKEAKASLDTTVTPGEGANWTFALTDFLGSDGKSMGAKITKVDDNNWTVKFPYGTTDTQLAAVKPVFTKSSDASAKFDRNGEADSSNVHPTPTEITREAVNLYQYGERRGSLAKVVTSGSTAIDLASYAGEDKAATFTLYQKGAVLEYINVTYSVQTKDEAGVNYISFNSQAAVDKYVSGTEGAWYDTANEKWISTANVPHTVPYAYDDDEGALLYAPLTHSSIGNDCKVNFVFDKTIDVSTEGNNYRFFRMTYRLATAPLLVVPNGAAGGATTGGNLYFNHAGKASNASISTRFDNIFGEAAGNKTTIVVDLNSTAKLAKDNSLPGFIDSLRLDLPGATTANKYHNIYVYDIGFFDSEQAAWNYPAPTTKEDSIPWTLTFTGFKDANGNDIAYKNLKKVEGSDTEWTVQFPAGTDTSAIKPVYTAETVYGETGYAKAFSTKNAVNTTKGHYTTSGDRGTIALYKNPEKFDRAKINSGSTSVDFGNTGKVDFELYLKGSTYEIITLNYEILTTSDKDVVDDLVSRIDALDFETALRGASSSEAVKAEVEALVGGVLTLYEGSEAAVSVTAFEAPSSEMEGNDYYAGTDGSASFSIAVSYGTEISVVQNFTVTVAQVGKPIIMNFASPALIAAFDATAANVEARIIKDENCLGGAYAKFTKFDDPNADYNLILTPGVVFPKNIHLNDYPIILMRARLSQKNDSIQVFAKGYSAGGTQTYLNANNNLDKSNEDGWYTVIQDYTNNAGWKGLWNTSYLRISLLRYANTKREIADIDYIGFFNNRKQALDFMANPTLNYDTVSEKDGATATIAEAIEAVEALDGTYTTNPGSLTANQWAQAQVKSVLNGYGYTLDKDYYIAFRKTETALDDPASKSNAYTYFTVVFTDNFLNAAFKETKEITMRVVDKAFDAEMLGAQLRADGERAIRFGIKVNVATSSAIAGSILNTNVNKFANLGITAEEGTTVTFGTLVVPKEALIAEQKDASRLTHELIGGDNKLSGTAFSSNNTFKYDYDYDVIDDEAEFIYEVAEDGSSFVYTTVVTSIPPNDGEVALVARAYAKITDKNGNVTYVYANPIERSFNALSNQWSDKTIFDDSCTK
ncbi:MAG: hypothetical protein E7588_07965 [Ruminococcaceae bacterium]|nr:hypothetical protein [Oscillospiraceae bacterium]